MHKEVKSCADKGDIKGLKYIFVDCLDVDPTFEKYKEDYEYCKNLNGLFESHRELTPFSMDKSLWNYKYWQKLKTDLLKNFSDSRFKHMIDIERIEKLKEQASQAQANKNSDSKKLMGVVVGTVLIILAIVLIINLI